ncbi:hypothetical protein [Candidatus Liberibacter brunswickensis]|uniref:hypothetical protein n=1 Tax=Candidatus Liberibacter brunswickensis TaxID=1968796 RepID=UPI002FE2C3DD
MKRISALGLLFVFLGLAINPAFAYKTYSCHGYGKNGCCKNVHVNGYCKRNGTCVKDYYRCSPKNH